MSTDRESPKGERGLPLYADSDALRPDVRENLEGAARAERFFNRNSIVLISDVLVDAMSDGWSRPVRLMVQRHSDSAIVEVTVQEIDTGGTSDT